MLFQEKATVYGGAVVAAAGNAVSWISQLNDVLQAVSLIVAILAGAVSIYFAIKNKGRS